MASSSAPIYTIPVQKLTGEASTLSQWAGKVMLVVNTASGCGYTPQFAGLETLYRKHNHKGFVVLGFPCNQFAGQEPLNESEIQSFCSLKYDVTFPMFSRIDVNGRNEHPLYALLKKEAPGLLGSKLVKWNFTKFLVDRTGKIVGRYAPQTTPEALEKDIEKLLA
jgi:glutathione peroxidase